MSKSANVSNLYDIIGDIHGYSKTLVLMLEELGYVLKNGFYAHPKRKIIFVGDFIDRGENVSEVLKIVKAMIDNNAAYTVIGNHEYNAIAFNTKNEKGDFLREHSAKNIKQIQKTLDNFKNKDAEWLEYLTWFKTLPIFLEFENFNVIHACWDFNQVNYIKKYFPENKITDELLQKSSIKGTPEYDAIDVLLKGKEATLPKDVKYIDKDGHPRSSVRYKWWIKLNMETYRTVAVNYEEQVPDVIVNSEYFKGHTPYLENQKPVFFGHYWKNGKPEIQTENVCCLDYSLAKCKKLVAYRYDGEKKLSNSKFVTVNCID